ncbi:MAG: AGE family epimerase/isomerase [Ancalomicrobiaceae bacterium]|nr:AGE family epimerase/isomerase [Ancalomicrobiaceae bacterium]
MSGEVHGPDPAIGAMRVNFRDPSFLVDHIRSILAFYDGRVVDPAGGFFHCYDNDGTVYDRSTRTLVASCRFVFNYAMAWRRFRRPEYLAWTRHGLDYLRRAHRRPDGDGYVWRIEAGRATDRTNHCYGLAFVLLAYATALKAGIGEARDGIGETFALMERHFWHAADGLYRSEADPDWHLAPYRGQNDNMHACEALIAAFEASGETAYLTRAATIAETVTRRLAGLAGGQIWEHYHPDWSLDLDYGKGDRSNHIRPWGVQTGHQTEWAKLLLMLDRHLPAPWHLERAMELFDRAFDLGWDEVHGGLIYGYDLDGVACDQDKYFWVQAETIAAAALLASRSGNGKYWDRYEKVWDYAWANFVDHRYGAWYRLLSPDNKRYDNRKTYNNKADYHTMGACHEVLRELEGD